MLLIYTTQRTPRFDYIVDFFSNQLFEKPIQVTTDVSLFRSHAGPKVNYSAQRIAAEEVFIQPTALLFETGVQHQELGCFVYANRKALYPTEGDYPFDIFAAVFYLVSRYEEYLPHEKDSFGRYDYRQSVAAQNGFLHLPLVNSWLADFRQLLSRNTPGLVFRHRQFKPLITYDIDRAYAYRYKPWWRQWGGWLHSIVTRDWPEANFRARVLRGVARDPNDCFEWLDALHLYCRVKPIFFFLVAGKTGTYDKNVSTSVKPFRSLIEYYASTYRVGLHPSWQSGDQPNLLREEAGWLEVVTEQPVTDSRQHYLRFSLPSTYRELIAAGITKDFSMGYGTVNGFRASIASSYHWYDLEREEKTGLEVFPFSFMDANAYFEQRMTPQAAYRELLDQYEVVKQHQGLFISIWHNYLLGTHPRFSGWREMFELFMRETVYWDAYNDVG